jgi:hypothetical protein
MSIEIQSIAMVAGLALVKVYKPRTFKQTQSVLDDEKNKGKDPEKDLMERKLVEQKVMYNVQTVEIVAIGDNAAKFEVGDIVLIDYRKLKEFDLYKGVNAINVYDILGKVNYSIV